MLTVLVLVVASCGSDAAVLDRAADAEVDGTETVELEAEPEPEDVVDGVLSQGDIVGALMRNLPTGDTSIIETYVAPGYVQHNVTVPTGREALLGMADQMAGFGLSFDVVRVLEDGDYAVAHTDAGEQVLFDVFRFEDGLIVEHWDNVQDKAGPNPSGRSMVDGATEITDLELTESNRTVVVEMLDEVLIQGNSERVTDYISTESYLQHNPNTADGLDGFSAAMAELADQGIFMEYSTVHHTIAQGNFVLAISEGTLGDVPTSFFDLFRLDDGLIVEHWDVIETIAPVEEQVNDNGKFNFPDGPVVGG